MPPRKSSGLSIERDADPEPDGEDGQDDLERGTASARGSASGRRRSRSGRSESAPASEGEQLRVTRPIQPEPAGWASDRRGAATLTKQGDDGHADEGDHDGQAAGSRDGRLWTRRPASGSSMAPVARGEAHGQRGQEPGCRGRGGERAARMSGSSSSLTRQTAPGTGKRAQMSRTSATPPRAPTGRPRSRSVRTMQLADLAHLEAAEAAGRRGRRAHADARRRVGGQRVEGDGVLVDGDADRRRGAARPPRR